MIPLAVFYHLRLAGGDPPVADAHALRVLSEQMVTLDQSGLGPRANLVLIGVNGDDRSAELVRSLAPDYATVVCHGADKNSELPTLFWLQNWLAHGQEWHVCYWHLKGARHPDDPLTRTWRLCMEKAVIRNWAGCVDDLERGFESAGAHWLTRAKYGPHVRTGFWGGNFWWARASFLRTLPRLPANRTRREDDFLAETWIGDGHRLPHVRDYADHWPGIPACAASLP